MTCTVKQVYEALHQLAPFDTAEQWDNVGLIIGNMNQPVSAILCALDCTLPVVEEAVAKGANVIFTHHPLLFEPVKQIHTSHGEGAIIARLITHNISLISAHTNGDLAPMGTSQTLATLFNLQNPVQQGYIITGDLPQALTTQALNALIAKKLKVDPRIYGPAQSTITRLAVGAGACGDEWPIAKAQGAQGFLSGEFKHHEILQGVGEGLVLFDGGHFATETPGLFSLGQCLQKALNELQYRLTVYYSCLHPYEK